MVQRANEYSRKSQTESEGLAVGLKMTYCLYCILHDVLLTNNSLNDINGRRCQALLKEKLPRGPCHEAKDP